MIVCPQWADDAAEHNLPELEQSMGKVWADACAEAKRTRPGRKEFRRWHLRTFRSLVPMNYYAGHFRQQDPQRPCLSGDAWVPQADGTRVNGTPYGEVLRMMEVFEQDLHNDLLATEARWGAMTPQERLLSTATTVGLAIAKFIQIHPFINGNGRMSRLLWAVLISRLGLPVPMAAVRRPGPPYPEMMAKAMQGDTGHAIALVLLGIGAAFPASDLQLQDEQA
jgi:fido (protein-threonine AMPylation protein)